MAILTKAQLEALNQSSFPDNVTGAITPQILRDYNTATIDTLVDSLDTGSFVQDLTSLNSFTASQEAKDSTLATYTGSVDTKFATIGSQSGSWENVPLTSLNAFTASQEQKDSTLATYTGSVDTKFSTIGTQSGSWDNTLLNQFTASQEQKDITLASYTASVDSSLSQLNSFTSSQEVKDNTLGAYTASNDTKWSNLGSQSGSWDNTLLNEFTQSQETKNSTLATYTGSIDTKFNTLGTQSGSWITESETGSMSVNYAVTASKAQDLYVNAKNTSGAIITKGSIVKITGASGDNPEIGLADWTNDGTSANTLGITNEDIAINAFSDIVVQGRVIGLNTNGFTAGQLLYLGPNGTYVASVPTPYHEVRLGQVLRSNISQGSIYLSVDNGYELSELHDVNIVTASLANNELLAYDSASQQWTNKTISSLGIPQLSTNNTFTGTLNQFQNISAVSASFQYIETVTGSAVIIGQSFIVVNNDTPTQPYGGLSVYDSGSVSPTTSSLVWDGNTNDWKYSYDVGAGHDAAVMLFGPAANGLQNTTYPSNNKLQKGDGGHHLLDSSIYDDGTLVSIGANVNVTGSIQSNGTAVLLEGALSQLNQFTSSQEVLNAQFATTGSNIFNGDLQATGYVSASYIQGPNGVFTNLYASNGVISGSSQISTLGFATTGSNTFNGNQIINGTSKQTFNEPGDNQEVQVVKVNSFTDSNGYSLQNNTWGWYHYNSEGHEGFASQLYTGDYAYGSAFFHDPEKWEYILFPSGAAYDTNKFGLYDLGNTQTKFVVQTDNIELTGSVKLTPASVSTNASYPIPFISGSTISKDSVDTLLYNPSQNALFVSASTGNSRIGNTNISVSSGSQSTSVGLTTIVSVVEPGQYIAFSGNPSKTGAPSLTTSTKPGILALSSSAQPYVAIELQPSASFTDGRVTIKRPLVVEQGITGSVTVGGNLVANKVSAFDFDTLFYGSQMGGSIANGTFLGYGSTNYEFVVGAYAGGFDNELKITADNTGITFRDFNGSSYPTWLKLNPNSGTNPAPILTRGVEITGSVNVSGTETISGSLIITGSAKGNVGSVSIVSNTASLDMSTANYFTLTLADSTNTHIIATNITPGQSATLVITTGTNSSASLAPTLLQPSGSGYVATQGSAKKDVLSLVSVDSTSMFVVSTKNMI
jgi:hypothetical protein